MRVLTAQGLYDDDLLTRDAATDGGSSGEVGGDGEAYETLVASKSGGALLVEDDCRPGWRVQVMGDVSLLNETDATQELLYEPYPYAD